VRPTSPVLWELGEGNFPRLPDHGAEHSSKLGRVMTAQTTADVTYVLRQRDDGGIRFPEDACDSRDNHVTGGRRERRRWTPQAPTT
jgi:hypothetical protein